MVAVVFDGNRREYIGILAPVVLRYYLGQDLPYFTTRVKDFRHSVVSELTRGTLQTTGAGKRSGELLVIEVKERYEVGLFI
jgi:hypothetical protein